METLTLDKGLTDRITQLDASGDINTAVAKLLLMKNQRELTKYELICKNFEKKYKTDFVNFKSKINRDEIDYHTEQDFFDWDMAITAIEDIKKEIEYLKGIIK
jgi:hypothetical protein